MPDFKDLPNWVNYEEKQKVEILADLGLMDKNDQAVFLGLCEYARKYQTSYLPLQGLYKFLNEYGLSSNINSLKLVDNIPPLLNRVFIFLRKKNYAVADIKDNKITALILTDPQGMKEDDVKALVERVRRDFVALEEDPEKNFPRGDYIPRSGLSSRIMGVLAVKELSIEKVNELQQQCRIVRLTVPPDYAIYIAADDLPRLYNRAFQKIRAYFMHNPDLGSLILMKLKQQFPSLSGVSHPADLMTDQNREPNFWIALTNEIIANSRENEREKNLNIAAQIVKAFSVNQGRQFDQNSHMQKTLSILIQIMEKYNVAMSRKQMVQLRDRHQYFKLYTEKDFADVVDKFIDKYTASDANTPPVLVSLVIMGEGRYIHRIHFLSTFLTKIDSITYQVRKLFIDRMDRSAASLIEDGILQDPERFEEEIFKFFKDQDETVVQMVNNPAVLFQLLRFAASASTEMASQLTRFFYPAAGNAVPSRRPLSEIFYLDQMKLFKETKSRLPLAMRFTFLRKILLWLQSFGKVMNKSLESQLKEKKAMDRAAREMFQKKEKTVTVSLEKESGPSLGQIKKEQIKKQLENFRNSVSSGKDPKELMQDLEKKWNLSILKETRDSNKALVKGKILSRLKFMKTYSPELVEKEADGLIKTEEILKFVHDTMALKQYVALYMTEYLLQKLAKTSG